ncbi:MFS general substrate transporter [Apiospora aurea]|uniref:MFS general substrate transporter n=1 Tax=Apiospora aurea TaxID=335848 RepID=A0ABR1Q1W0_9PEZI
MADKSAAVAAPTAQDTRGKEDAAGNVSRPVPNSGVAAWLQVLGAFCLYFNTWGLLSTFGSFQAYYETELLAANTAFQVSTIGSLQSFVLVFLGFLAGPPLRCGLRAAPARGRLGAHRRWDHLSELLLYAVAAAAGAGAVHRHRVRRFVRLERRHSVVVVYDQASNRQRYCRHW